jgi:hypothetical protein
MAYSQRIVIVDRLIIICNEQISWYVQRERYQQLVAFLTLVVHELEVEVTKIANEILGTNRVELVVVVHPYN